MVRRNLVAFAYWLLLMVEAPILLHIITNPNAVEFALRLGAVAWFLTAMWCFSKFLDGKLGTPAMLTPSSLAVLAIAGVFSADESMKGVALVINTALPVLAFVFIGWKPVKAQTSA